MVTPKQLNTRCAVLPVSNFWVKNIIMLCSFFLKCSVDCVRVYGVSFLSSVFSSAEYFFFMTRRFCLLFVDYIIISCYKFDGFNCKEIF